MKILLLTKITFTRVTTIDIISPYSNHSYETEQFYSYAVKEGKPSNNSKGNCDKDTTVCQIN